jgi:hypothetical protein
MRPLNERECIGGQQAVFQCLQGQNAIAQLRDGQPMDRETYHYDKVFNGQATTAEVYTHIARDAVKNVANGINGTIFAYGQVPTTTQSYLPPHQVFAFHLPSICIHSILTTTFPSYSPISDIVGKDPYHAGWW